jgi:hypothetical protein
MNQDTYPQGLAVDAARWPVPHRAGALLGSYRTESGRRDLRAVDTLDEGVCLIDEAPEDALLVEPQLEQMAEARARRRLPRTGERAWSAPGSPSLAVRGWRWRSVMSRCSPDRGLGQRGDETALFERYAQKLVCAVRRELRIPDDLEPDRAAAPLTASSPLGPREPTLRERLRLERSESSVPRSLPVLFFGDALAAHVATVGLNPSKFEYLDRRGESSRTVEDNRLTGRIAEIHADSRKTYGSPRVHAELRLKDGVRVGRKRVERMMRRAGLSGQVKRRRGKTTVRVRGVRTAPIFVDRGFSQTAINRL